MLSAVESGGRLHVWEVGRRSGKTSLAALVGLWDCLLRREPAGRVRRRERRFAVVVATNKDQAAICVNQARSIVEASPILSAEVVGSNSEQIEFRNGTVFRAFPCSSRAGRGWAISTLIMDEAAHFVSETEGYQTADKVWEALNPATYQFGDLARVLVLSTPYGEDGFFADLCNKVSSGEVKGNYVHATTFEVNLSITEEMLAEEKARDPDAYAQETLAQRKGSGASYLDMDRVMAVVSERGPLGRDDIFAPVAGLDPAFSSDPFGLAIVGRDCLDRSRIRLAYVDAILPPAEKPKSFEARRQIEDRLLDEAAEILRRYGVRQVVTDQYAASDVIERLQRKHGFHVRREQMTGPSKTAIYRELRAQLYTAGLELYDDAGLLTELRRLKTNFTAGSANVVNPRVGRSHGDKAQALALAVAESVRLGRGFAEKLAPLGENVPGIARGVPDLVF